jgi:hypothetical protein
MEGHRREAVMRLNDDFHDEVSSSVLTWAGGAAVTAGILVILAAAQVAT